MKPFSTLRDDFHYIDPGVAFSNAPKWYIVFETYCLCHQGTCTPKPFKNRKECQTYIDEHCLPREFPEVEFIRTNDVNELIRYVQEKK